METVKEVIIKKPRTLIVTLDDEKTLYLDTDTGYSLANDSNEFIRILTNDVIQEKKWWNITYVKRFNLKPYDKKLPPIYTIYKLFYFYEIVSGLDKFLNISNSDNMDVFDQLIAGVCVKHRDFYDVLKTRAKITHTLSNMILIPSGYNNDRYQYIKDDMYKTLESYRFINDHKDIVCNILNNNNNENFLLNKKTVLPMEEVDFLTNDAYFYMNYTKVKEDTSLEDIKNRSNIIIENIHNKKLSKKL